MVTSSISTCSALRRHSGAIESSTQNVHSAFTSSLNDSLKMQDEIYLKMQQKGWYPTQQVDENKINTVKQKFQQNCCQ